MFGFLPPSSIDIRLTVSAALLMTSRPVSTPPVKAILSTRGSATSAAPVVGPSPVTMLTTPGGQIELLEAARPASSAVSGVCSAGFSTAVHPAASAGASFQAAISSG